MSFRRLHIILLLAMAVLVGQFVVSPAGADSQGVPDGPEAAPLAPYPATWLYHFLYATPIGSRAGVNFGTAIFDSSGDGTFSGTSVESGSPPAAYSGTMSMIVDASGKTIFLDTTDPDVRVTIDNAMLSPDQDVIVGSRWEAGDEPGPFISVRRGSGYAASDLEGTWVFTNAMITPTGAGSSLGNGVVVLDNAGDGTFNLAFEDNEGHTDSDSGTVSVAVDGNGTVTVTDTTGGGSDVVFDNGILSADKTLIVFTDVAAGDHPEIGILVKRGTDYEPGDIAGNWVFHSTFFTSDLIGSGLFYGTFAADASGVGTTNDMEIDNLGWSEMFSESLELSVDSSGTVTMTEILWEPPELVFDNGIMSPDKNLIVAAHLSDGDEVELFIMTRDGKGFGQSDGEGDWESNTLLAGSGAPWWRRGPLTIGADGSFSGTMTEYDGSPVAIAGDLRITADGFVTSSDIDSQWQGVVDVGKTVLVATKPGADPDTAEADVVLKKAGSYASADLLGDWHINLLATGPAAPWWDRGTMTIASGGAVSGAFDGYDGDSDSLSGTMSITSGGIISWSEGYADWRGVLDAHKTVMVWTDTFEEEFPGDPEAGTSEMAVLLKKAGSYSVTDLEGLWQLNSLVSGPAAPDWTRGYVMVDENGLFAGQLIDLDGSIRWFRGILGITSGGIITITGVPGFSGAMDAGKTVIAATQTLTDLDETSQLEIWVKTGTAKWFEIYPKSPMVSTGEYVNFTTPLGMGEYAFDVNDSGGTIDPDTGLYHAGTTGDVADVLLTYLGAGTAVTIIEVDSAPRAPGRVGPPTSMDVNGSGVTIADVILMLRHVVGLDTFDALQQLAADFDLSGSVTIGDVINALRTVVGLAPIP